ncbi:MAG: hypothetical protein GX154_11845 [Clostridiales bacterium]|nr:hypothetical protein [Clostridiales bacterium]
MADIKIYKITITQGYLIDRDGYSYSLLPCDAENCEGYDDGGQIYTLPTGYNLEERRPGSKCIYSPGGKACILKKLDRYPAIADGNITILLAKSQEKYKSAGKWKDMSIDLIHKDGKTFALNGWDGESYISSWEVKGIDSIGEYNIRPVYAQQADDSSLVVVDYEIIGR